MYDTEVFRFKYQEINRIADESLVTPISTCEFNFSFQTLVLLVSAVSGPSTNTNMVVSVRRIGTKFCEMKKYIITMKK